jgi:hypothetical protein
VKFSDAGHPVWKLARLGVVMVSLTAILWLNATNFDRTELTSIVEMFLLLGSGEGVTQIVRAWKHGGKTQSAEIRPGT